MDGRLRIGELGDRVGLSTATLRYYESLGLLGEPERSPSGYRLYGEDDEERLRFIIRAKALDLSLDEIRSLLELWHQGTCTETRSTLRHLVAHKIREARSRAQEAAAFADQLTHVYARLGEEVSLEVPVQHLGTSAPGCGCIPDLPPAEALDLDAELALIDQSVCGCGARLDEVAGAPEACACGCCAPAGSGGKAEPAGSGGKAEPAGSGGKAEPAGSGGKAEPAGSGGKAQPVSTPVLLRTSTGEEVRAP